LQRHIKTHTLVRDAANRSFHNQKKTCTQCGYPAAKMPFEWRVLKVSVERLLVLTLRTLKYMPRRFKNGFREGTVAKKLVVSNERSNVTVLAYHLLRGGSE
jgi:large subunit ribosomal protein L37e